MFVRVLFPSGHTTVFVVKDEPKGAVEVRMYGKPLAFRLKGSACWMYFDQYERSVYVPSHPVPIRWAHVFSGALLLRSKREPGSKSRNGKSPEFIGAQKQVEVSGKTYQEKYFEQTEAQAEERQRQRQCEEWIERNRAEREKINRDIFIMYRLRCAWNESREAKPDDGETRRRNKKAVKKLRVLRPPKPKPFISWRFKPRSSVSKNAASCYDERAAFVDDGLVEAQAIARKKMLLEDTDANGHSD